MPQNQFALAIGNPPFSDTVIKSDPKYTARGFMLHDYASIAAWNLGMKDEAIHQAELALSYAPHDDRLRKNLELCKETS